MMKLSFPYFCSNVVAATDSTLLALAGIGLHNKKVQLVDSGSNILFVYFNNKISLKPRT